MWDQDGDKIPVSGPYCNGGLATQAKSNMPLGRASLPGRRPALRTTWIAALDLLSQPEDVPTRRLTSILPSLACWPWVGGGGRTGAATTIICSSCCSGLLAAAPVPCMGMATDAGAARQGLLSSPHSISPDSLAPRFLPASLHEAKLCSVHLHYVPSRTIGPLIPGGRRRNHGVGQYCMVSP
jgi:hypothetical protein